MYTQEEIDALEAQYKWLTEKIRVLQADRRKIQRILYSRRDYENKMGRKVRGTKRYTDMTSAEKREYNREKQAEHRKKIKEESEDV